MYSLSLSPSQSINWTPASIGGAINTFANQLAKTDSQHSSQRKSDIMVVTDVFPSNQLLFEDFTLVTSKYALIMSIAEVRNECQRPTVSA